MIALSHWRKNVLMGWIAVAVFLALFATTHAQVERSEPSREKQAGAISQTKRDSASAEIYLARAVSEKLWDLRDLRSRTVGTAKLARLLWKQDRTFARGLFEKALNLTTPANDSDDVKLRLSLKRNVIRIIASCDREWARQLIDAATKNSTGYDRTTRSSMNVWTALELLSSDSAGATEFARRSVDDDITAGPLLDFLQQLRKTDEQSANELFLYILSRISAQPVPDVKGLHYLGLYIFTAPNPIGIPDAIVMTLVDRLVVPKITDDRPGIPVSLLRGYLSTAGNVLWKALPDTSQRQQSYVLGYLLLPKAKRSAPDLASRIETAMSAMSTQINPSLTDGTAYKYIDALPSTPEESLAKADAKPDQYSKDIAYFDIAAAAWRRSDFKTARTANSKIYDLNASKAFTVLIDFAEAATQLKAGPQEIDDVLRVAYKLPAGIERAVLLLAVAEAAIKAGKLSLAEETLDATIKAALALEDPRRPFLLCIASSHLMAMKSSAGESSLANSVKDFNRFDDERYSSLEWKREIEVGPLKLGFPLNVAGLEFSFEQAIKRALAADFTAPAVRMDELRNQDLKMRGLLEVASAHLRKAEEIQKSGASSPKP